MDENLAEAHTSLGHAAAYYDWNWQEAEKEYRRAIVLNQNSANTHLWYGQYLDWMGRFEEGLLELSRARELEPQSINVNALTGIHYYVAREYEQAAKQIITALEMNPNFAYAHYALGMVYREKPILGDAIAEFQRALALEGSNPRYIGSLGIAYMTAGKQSEASKILSDLRDSYLHLHRLQNRHPGHAQRGPQADTPRVESGRDGLFRASRNSAQVCHRGR